MEKPRLCRAWAFCFLDFPHPIAILSEMNKDFDPVEEWAKCSVSVVYFIYTYCYIYSAQDKKWIPFKLWPEQAKVVKSITENRKTVIVKTRQFGFSWICRAIILHAAIFRPVVNAIMFSKSLDDAKKLISKGKGLKGMYERLPDWMKPAAPNLKDNSQELVLGNGSVIEARPYTQAEGDTYSHCFIDEVDRFPNHTDEELMANIGPAIEEAAEMIVMGSISDKARPNSLLKNTYRAAVNGENDWVPIFIPWSARPGRTQAWYDKILNQKIAEYKDLAQALDWMYQQYPGTPEQAMAPNSQSKRIPYHQLQQIYIEQEPLRDTPGAPAVEGLSIYKMPVIGRRYVLGADPAEGVLGGDDSSCDVLDWVTGEQVACLRGKFEPKKVFPTLLFDLATFYNDAGILVERNNHGWGVLATLPELIAERKDSFIQIFEYPYELSPKPGWLSSPRGKALLYNEVASQVKDEEVVIHNPVTVAQLADIDIVTLLAGDGDHDDAADSFALACAARLLDPMVLEGQLVF